MSQLEQETLENAPSVAPTDPHLPHRMVTTMPEARVALTKSTRAVQAGLPWFPGGGDGSGRGRRNFLHPGIAISIDDVSDDDYARLI